MSISLSADHLGSIRAHGVRDYPNECCGILFGRAEGKAKEVVEVAPLPNLRHDSKRAQEVLPLEQPGRESERNRFLIDPMEQLKAEKEARKRGLDVVGYYSE